MNDPFLSDPNDPPDWDALARYIAGESSPQEISAIDLWLSREPGRAELLRGLNLALERTRVPVPADLDVEGALRAVRSRMEGGSVASIEGARAKVEERAGAKRTKRIGPLSAPVWALRAAAVLLVVAAGALFLQIGGAPGRGGPATEVAQAFSTGVGEVTSMVLPDGSRAVLGPGSSLTIGADFGSGGRHLTLSGEALFDVAPDAPGAFIVSVGNAVVEDLGTAFSVRGGAGLPVRVVVTEGSVELRPAGDARQSAVLTAGDVGTLMPDGVIQLAAGAATPDDVAWTRGVLSFRDTPMDQVRLELRRWYGMELLLGDPEMERRQLTATFMGEGRQEVARVVALALGGDLEMRGDTAVIASTAAR